MKKFMAIWLLLASSSVAIAEFRYSVRRERLWGGESGVLTFGEAGVAYRSDNAKTAIDLPYLEVRKIDVSDKTKVRIWTYDRVAKRLTLRQKLEFELVEEKTSEQLPEFLASWLTRPALGKRAGAVEGVEIPVYHRHVIGGCDGMLVLGDTVLQFSSEEAKHSRTWPFDDLETIGSMDPFHFRVSSYAETYNFDLKERLSEEDYRSLWLRLYGMNLSQKSSPESEKSERLE